MYQESNTANVTKRSDTLLLIGLIVLIILSRSLLNFIQAAGGGILQLYILYEDFHHLHYFSKISVHI